MPTYLLDSGEPVDLGALPLRITASVQRGGRFALETRARADSVIVRSPRPDLVVLAAVQDSATVAITAVGGSAFAADTTVVLEIAAGPSGAGDRAVLGPLRIGGLLERELVTVRSAGGPVTVSAVAATADELELGPLGDAARAAASSLLGVPALPSIAGEELRVAVDGSASFRGRVADGSVGAVLNVLAGVASVVAAGRPVQVAVLSSDAPVWHPVEADAVRSVLVGALAAVPASTGLQLPDGAARTFFVTDGSSPLPVNTGLHEVVVEHSAVALAGPPAVVDRTVVEPGLGPLADGLLADAARLGLVVESLLSRWVAIGRNVP